MRKQLLSAVFAMGVLGIPHFVHAASVTSVTNGGVTMLTSTYCPNLSRSLGRGSRGADVTALQQFLIVRGLLSGDAASGYFGAMTEKAVQQFQAGSGIVSSDTAASTGFGFVGAHTRAIIGSTCSTSAAKSVSNVKTCPPLLPLACPGGTITSLGTDANGCSTGTRCTMTQTVSTCSPDIPPACPGGVVSSLGVDAHGCSLGYQCSISTVTPSLKLSAQVINGVLSAAWQSDYAPSGATVSLYLVPIDGFFPATITSGQSTTGTFFWTVPATYCSGAVCGIPISGQYHLHIDVLSGAKILLSKDSDNFTLPVR